MKVNVLNFKNEICGEADLDSNIFELNPRQDIIKRVIEWQLAKARSGTHKTKTVTEVSGTTKKPFKQKGTGNARQGSLRSVQMRGGGISHGPVVRSHATKLPKQIRVLGLKHALSAKMQDGKLLILENFELNTSKTSILNKLVANFNGKSLFFIDGFNLKNNFALAIKNIKHTIAVPHLGANVYDIIKHDIVILAKEAISILEERLK